MADTKGRFLTGSTMGHIMRMTITGTAGITFVFIVDAINLFWISWLNDVRLIAAMGFSFSIQFLSVSVGIGLMIAATAMVSKAIGEGRLQKARKLATSIMIICGAVQSLVALIIIVFRHEFLAFMGPELETAKLAQRYLFISLFSLPIMAIGMAGSAILRAEGDGVRAMLVTLTPGAFAMLIDPVLIVYLKLGLDGAAIGICISRFVMAFTALWFVIRHHNLLARPRVFRILRDIKPFLFVAGPTILTQLSTPVGNYFLTIVMAGFGDSAVAAWAVVNRLTVLSFGGIFSLSGAIGGIFGQNFGAKEFERLKTTYRDGLIFCIGYVILIWFALVLLNDVIIQAFNIDDFGADIIWTFTHFTPGSFIFTGVMFVACSVFNNSGKPLWSTGLNWARDGLFTLPTALLISGSYAASGVIYAQGIVAIFFGIIAVIWGLHYVLKLN